MWYLYEMFIVLLDDEEEDDEENGVGDDEGAGIDDEELVSNERDGVAAPPPPVCVCIAWLCLKSILFRVFPGDIGGSSCWDCDIILPCEEGVVLVAVVEDKVSVTSAGEDPC